MSDPRLPAACSIAFKEWAGICDALASGRQSIILRKGGIEEGPGGFVPEHPVFWLYPTRVHQAAQGLKADLTPGPHTLDPDDSQVVSFRALARVDSIGRVDKRETLPELDALHAWTPETVAARFHYRRPGLWVLGVRIFLAPEPRRVPITSEHAGCKTWVPLVEELSTTGLTPLIDDALHAERLDKLLTALAS